MRHSGWGSHYPSISPFSLADPAVIWNRTWNIAPSIWNLTTECVNAWMNWTRNTSVNAWFYTILRTTERKEIKCSETKMRKRKKDSRKLVASGISGWLDGYLAGGRAFSCPYPLYWAFFIFWQKSAQLARTLLCPV